MTGSLSRPRASTVNKAQARSAQSVTLSGLNRRVPLIYGEVRTQGVYLVRPFTYLVGINRLVLCIGWSHGECEGVQDISINGIAVDPIQYSVAHYTGTNSQAVDPTLALRLDGFDDTFPGIAYSVFVFNVTAAEITGWPRVEVVFRGRKVYDPRDETTAWSMNPALCLADFCNSTAYGPGLDVIGTAECADRCDENYEGEARCEFNYIFNEGEALETILDIFSLYAECLWAHDGSSILIVPDAPVLAPAATLTKRDVVADSLQLSASGAIDAPTTIIISYLPTSGSADSWVDEPARQTLVGVDDGDIEEVESVISMPGLRRLQEALRKANNRLRRLQFPGMYSWQAFDAGIRFQRGDVVALPDHWGLNGQWVRILSTDMVAYGLWNITAEHYDASVYGDEIVPDGEDGIVPVGLILPYVGSLPGGWADYSDADGRYIVGAGGDLDVGDTGGTETYVGFSGNLGTGGLHTGAAGSYTPITIPETSAAGAGAVARTAAAVNAGSHTHTYATGTITPNLYRRHNKLMIKTGTDAVVVPSAALIFGVPGILSGAIQRVTDYNGRFLVADDSNADAGVSSLGISLTSGVTSDSHFHSQALGQQEVVGSIGTPSFTITDVGGGSHLHSLSAEINRNVRARHTAVYGGTGGFPIRPGMIGIWDGDIGSLPADWHLCDGTNGTVDWRDYFLVLGGETLPAPSGDNTISISSMTNYVAHKHQNAPYTAERFQVGMPHANEVTHAHALDVSAAWMPPYIALAFIQYLPGE